MRAEARLTRDGAGMVGSGTARRNPDDREVTQIGQEIAAARALSDLAHQLLSYAAGQIEEITHQRAHLRMFTAGRWMCRTWPDSARLGPGSGC